VQTFAERAAAVGADIVVFPELALSGYPPEDLLLKPHFLQRISETVGELAVSLPPLVVVAGYPREQSGRNYNSAAVFSGGSLRAAYDKMLLPNYGVFDEKRYFYPGETPALLECNSVLFGVTICEDIWGDDGPCSLYTSQGAQVILNLSASPYHKGKMSFREELLRKRAAETGAYFFYVNLVGGQDELVFDGGSLVVSPEGEILARGRQFAEDLVLCDVALPPHSGRVTFPVTRLDSPRGGKPPIASREEVKLSPVEEVYGALVLGLRDYVEKNGFSKVILGLSGGIDSALTACIAVDALGAERVEALTMPSAFSSRETQNDARLLAENLGICLHTVPIGGIYERYLEELQSAFRGREPDITEENIQARIRGNILMAFSNKFGRLVLTTGNKSETSVGYCTLYGDTAGGFAVLKDVYKTLVYELARLVNERAGKELIPRTIFDRPPTAELKPDQKDEDTLPPYPVLDMVLEAYIENDKSALEIIAEGFDAALVYRVVDMVDRNEYKRRQAPSGIKITPKAFGKDRRMPITNRFQSH
jgi:NAD+ synthase (glutamine-hydrolysing)